MSNEDEQGVELVVDSVPAEKTPGMDSVEWNDYVLSQFADDEMEGKNPKVPGLRRVAQKLLGTIVSSKPVRTDTLILNDSLVSVCTYELMIEFAIGDIRIFGGVADAYKGNTVHPFDKHPSAMAETRAEGRALRRALGLKNVVAAEEMIDSSANSDDADDKLPVTKNQINAIDYVAKRINLNVVAYLTSLGLEVGKLTFSQGAELNAKISAFQSDVTEIPVEFHGYVKDWSKNND